MKAWKIKRARKKILSKNYYKKRLELFANKCTEWHLFYERECDTSLKEPNLADYNRNIYRREYPRAQAHLKWYYKKCFVKRVNNT